MRAKIMVGAAVVACALFGSGAAFAAGATASSDSLSGTAAGSMTCGQFQALSADARKDLVQQIGKANANSSLTSNSGSTGDNANPNSSVSAKGSPLTGGQIIAACQAATPATLVIDAYSQFSSGSGAAANGLQTTTN